MIQNDTILGTTSKKKNGKFNDIEIKGGRGLGPKHNFKKHPNDDNSRRGGWGSERKVIIKNMPQNPILPTNFTNFS